MIFRAFESHLKDAYPQHLAPVYSLIVSNEDERRQIAEYTIKVIAKAKPNLRLVKTEEIDEMLGELASFSLLGDLPLVFLDNVKKKFTYQVPEGAHLILGLAKPIAKFSEGIILDLSKEKPWDRDKRIATQVVAHAHALGKQIDQACLNDLFQAIGMDLALLLSEVDKLACYVGQKPVIDINAARALVMPSKEQSTWSIAEELVWQRRLPRRIESNDFPILIGSIRYQLELGLTLAVSPETVSEKYPKLRPRSLDKFRNFGLPASYFEKWF